MHSVQQLHLVGRPYLNKSTFGSKVSQNVLIPMKLNHNMFYCLLNVYTKFQIDISKHIVKKPRKLFKNSNTHKNDCQNSQKLVFCDKQNFEGFLLICEAMIAKNEFDLLLAIK